MKLILICGIPGTGKTTLGNHLRRKHGFLHINRERERWDMTSGEFVALLRRKGQDTVITWGFWPGQDDAEVRNLQRLGFRLVWLDGDPKVALHYFNRRGGVPEHLFHDQMSRIERMDLTSFGAVKIDPFDPSGAFKPVEEIVKLVLEET